ncbi:MAG TPA: hypothetical protein VET65_00355 [Candidatus Limnocylindrales bacterium]|nr:hypothetical protein [Candidatus Limnocylindrales bacterium]
MSRRNGPPGEGAWRWAHGHLRDRNRLIYVALLVGVVLFPPVMGLATGVESATWVGTAADAGVFVLLAIGLNVVVGFAGLLDLGYAAFFAIGAYTYGMLASGLLSASPLHHEIHLPFWLLIFVGMFMAACFGILLGAPTLRLRGDYLAIVTLGFGEIVPTVFRNLGPGSPIGNWTGGINGISAIDPPHLPALLTGPFGFAKGLDFTDPSIYPIDYYVLMVVIVVGCVILVSNLYSSRLGRAWMAVREDEVAAAANGVNTVAIKLLAFAIGASFSGFAGAFYGAKLSLVSSENFSFVISVTVLLMVVLGGMGNIPGVIVGSLTIYSVLYVVLPNLPGYAQSAASAVGLGFLNQPGLSGNWSGLGDEVQRLNFLLYGLILVVVMVLRPQGLIPSRVREQELAKGTEEEAVFDLRET